MQKHLLPIGIDNFGKLIRHRNPAGDAYLFTDKSLLIKEFISESAEISLITRPRRFGKTLNLSMLEHFFAKDVYGEKTAGIFDGLKIAKHPEIMAYQGKYPVIFLTLKEVRGKNFEEAFSRIKLLISQLFDAHRYLLKNPHIEKNKVAIFQRILNQEASQADYEASIQFLSHLLYQHTGQKAIILLDEYDTPMHDAYTKGYYEELRGFMATMFNKAFKGNHALHKAMITGILKVVKSSLFSELNNVKVYTVLSEGYDTYFGFTQEETDELLSKAGLPKGLPELKQMYNGYQIGKQTIYNPFSIVNFIDEASRRGDVEEALKPYWINTGGHGLIYDLVSQNITGLQPGLTDLINNKSIVTRINEDIVLGKSLQNNTVAFWSLLMLAGYLKPIEKEFGPLRRLNYKVLFPNEEIRMSMADMLLEWIAGGADRTYPFLEAMESLVGKDLTGFKAFLEDYVRETPSFMDTKGRYKEQFFHGLLLGMTASLSHSHRITSNRISGKGLYDIALQPKDKGKMGVVMELKITDMTQGLEQVAQDAYTQVIAKQYAQEMQAQGITTFRYVGIAFCGDEVVVSDGQG